MFERPLCRERAINPGLLSRAPVRAHICLRKQAMERAWRSLMKRRS